MKILTLNTHSLMEADNDRALQAFVRGVLETMPDVIALQEVNQRQAAAVADASLLEGYVPVQTEIPVRRDNYAAQAARLLREAGVEVSWTYLPVKLGYGCFDEGLAMLSLGRRIVYTESFLLSRSADYNNWKTRKVLGIQLEGCADWFYNVHMGWWEDEDEPFMVQWKILHCFLTTKPRYAPVWLMGDFNAPAEIRSEGYDHVADAGWYDTYVRAGERRGQITIPGGIDGWQGISKVRHGARIDQVWCSMPVTVNASTTVFDGENQPKVSDHYGVLVDIPPRPVEVDAPVTWDDLMPDMIFEAV